MNAYYTAIMDNKDAFQGKVVLDVGTGTGTFLLYCLCSVLLLVLILSSSLSPSSTSSSSSFSSGILAMWAARAGARHVYAVEKTDMAQHARKLVQQNGLSEVVTVVKSSIEELELPEKVDIIISEWMGMILLRESMLDSVLRARDKFLKEDGSLWPSHCAIFISAMGDDEERTTALQAYRREVGGWDDFADRLKSSYGIDYSSMKDDFQTENMNYFKTARWQIIDPSILLGEAQRIYHIDLKKMTFNEAEGFHETSFNLNLSKIPLLHRVDDKVVRVKDHLHISGFALWFSVDFYGGETPLTMSTGPENGYTHWGQYALSLLEPFASSTDLKRISGTLSMKRKPFNPRMYSLELKVFNESDIVVVDNIYDLA